MNKINIFLVNIGKENKFGFYFSFFRIFICIVLLKDIIFSYKFTDILYKGTSFVTPSSISILDFLNINSSIIRDNIPFFFAIYASLIVLFIFGIGRNVTAFFVYVLYEFNQGLSHFTQNGGDNLLKFVLLYMVFANSFQHFSVESKKENDSLSNTFSNLAGHSIQLHLCLAYFLSAIHKVHSDVWFNGVATYYTLSLERFRGTDFNLWLAKNGVFVTFSTYFTMLFELFFPIGIWNKSFRKILIVCGILVHSGIFVFMMIYDFQIIFLMTYGFFISELEWQKFINFKVFFFKF